MTHRRARRGITLLEMLIVLALIGLMAGIAWPAATTALDSIRLRAAADSVASLLAQAALRVERRQQPVEIIIDLGRSQFAVVGVAGNDRRELQLEPGISVTSVEPALVADSRAGDEQPEERRFVLMPGAGWPALRIELANPRRVRRIVKLDPISGAPEIQTADAGDRP